MLTGVSAAHELEENQATLVMRGRTHVAVTRYLNYAEALHLALAPERPYTAFLLVFLAMGRADMEKELARTKFEAETRMGPGVSLDNSFWPGAAQGWALTQQQAMRDTVDPRGHAHAESTEVRREAVAGREIGTLQVKFPEEFKRVLVVSYRPRQVWVEGKGTEARF